MIDPTEIARRIDYNLNDPDFILYLETKGPPNEGGIIYASVQEFRLWKEQNRGNDG